MSEDATEDATEMMEMAENAPEDDNDNRPPTHEEEEEFQVADPELDRRLLGW
jgi:hypothetical protein